MNRIIYKFIAVCLFSISTISYVQAQVVTSIKPLAYVAQAISEGVDEVTYIVPDGASPHSYSLTPNDVLKMKNAELMIWIGPEMEGFILPLMDKLNQKSMMTLTEDKNIASHLMRRDNEEHNHNHNHGDFDMHIWLSPELMERAAILMHDRLLKSHPDKAQLLDSNLANFRHKLNQTKETIAKNSISIENKPYFVFHDAYRYFESEFKLSNLGSITVNPAVQPGVKTVFEIQNKIKNNQVICIFSEPQFDPRVVDKIISGTTIRTEMLDPLGINIPVTKDGYFTLLTNLSDRFQICLK